MVIVKFVSSALVLNWNTASFSSISRQNENAGDILMRNLDARSNNCCRVARVELCCPCPSAEPLSPLWSQARCAPWWKICSPRSRMMMTAPPEKRQQSKQTQSAAIPGGNKSGRKMFVCLPVFGVSVFPLFGGRNRSDGATCERSMREGAGVWSS